MRTNLYLSSFLAASFGLGASAAAQHTGAVTSHAGTQTTADTGVVALLTGPLGTRSPTGRVTVDGRSVRVAWSGDQPGVTRTWYVHKGSCRRDEGMVGAPSAYRPIVADARGTGSGTATLDAPLSERGSYFVAVHGAASGGTPDVIACGSLSTGGTQAGQPGAHEMGDTPMDSMAGMGQGRAGAQAAGSAMAGMDHSAMNMSMNRPGMQPAQGAAPAPMDHSRMGQTTPPARSGADSATAVLMAMHTRMMADPVIRERVMTDPVMRSLMARMPAERGAMMPMMPPMMPAPSGGVSHEGMNMPGVARPGATTPAQAPARRPTAPAKPTTRASAGRVTPANRPAADPHAGHQMAPSTRPAAPKPAAKPAAKPAPAKKDSMPGMDHSKMPGMGKP